MEVATSYTYYGNGVKPSRPEDSGNKYAYAKYSAYKAERAAREKAEALIERFVEVYGETPLHGSMIGPGLKLWRDYYEWTGDHMILTDEGWEPGSAKASYEEMAAAEELPIGCFIQDEVNAPAVKAQ